MITSFEVGAVLKIINEASPALRKILAEVRELSKSIEQARANLAQVSTIALPGLAESIKETRSLARAWGNVAKNSEKATRSIAGAVAAARNIGALPSLPAPPRVPPAGGGGRGAGGGGSGGGGRHRPGWLSGGSGAHVSGPGIGIPGGGHIRLGGAAMAGAGLIGYGAYEAAEMEDAVWQLIYHSGLEQNDANRSKFRKMLQDSMAESGYGLHDISESAKQEIRMFQGTKGGGIDVLPEMLRAATIESRLKGESPEESMKALIGLAHMTKQYSPEDIKKLAPAFAFLSTANPGSLSSIEKAAGYAVPLLQSGLEIDPMQSLLLGTALTRAGATSTKSGTWLREMALRAMPGTSMMSKMAFKKHEEALKAFGLVGDDGKPTWFDDKGKPDIFKMLDIAGSRANSIPIEKRAAYERSLFGAQGGGGFALLADPAVREQVQALQKDMNSPEFKNRYAGFAQAYQEGSTVQNARTAMSEFNNTMMDLGQHVLPSVNAALKDFKAVLEALRGMVPGVNKDTAQTSIGSRAMEGAAGGAVLGSVIPGIGTVAGGIGGGILGTAEGFMENYSKAQGAKQNRKETDEFLEELRKNHAGAVAGAPAQAVMAPISLNLNIDGRTLSQALINIGASSFEGQAPAFDGMSAFPNGDHQYTDK